MKTKILILTPTLGSSPYLEETVRSVQAGEAEIRHVLVCPEPKIAELRERFPQCEVIADAGKAGGLYGALNAGLTAANGGWDWYTYINDDDLLAPGFAKLVERHCRPEDLGTVAYGDIETIDGEGASLGRMTVEGNPVYFPALLHGGISPTGQQGMIFGARVVEALRGYNLKYRICADLEFWVRAYAQGFPFHYYPLEVGRFRIRPGQISGEVSLLREQVDEIAHAHLPAPVSPAAMWTARMRYRWNNLPRYLGRLRAVGFARSLDVLETGGRAQAKKGPA